MQSQGMTSKVAIKVPEKQVLRVERKKIKDAFNMLIQVLEESRRISDVSKSYCMACMLSYLLSF